MLAKARTILDARRAKLPRGIYEGNVAQVAPSLAEHYSAEYPWSASRLEAYASCPFQFFSSSALGLEVLEAPQIGYQAGAVTPVIG